MRLELITKIIVMDIIEVINSSNMNSNKGAQI